MRIMKTTIYKIKLKKGDTVMVRAGKQKGQTGKVTAVHPSLNKVTVEGINMLSQHRRSLKVGSLTLPSRSG
jgi:ribosomal protein L24